eukprot:Rhum_TRINITY_DN14117_c25_g1::Rhum_TRINITY_DN14117_c25_g1_i1::g.72219::m.72219
MFAVRRNGARALLRHVASSERQNLVPRLDKDRTACMEKEKQRIQALRTAVTQLSGGHEPVVAAGAEIALVYVPAADALVLSTLSFEVCAEGLGAVLKSLEQVLRTYLAANPSMQETWTNWRDVALAELCLEYLRQAESGLITLAAAVEAIIQRIDVAIASKYSSAPCVKARVETLRRICDNEPDVDPEPTVFPEAETTTAEDLKAHEETVQYMAKKKKGDTGPKRHVAPGKQHHAKQSSPIKRFANLTQARPSGVDALFATQKAPQQSEKEEEEQEQTTALPAADEEGAVQEAPPAEEAPRMTTAAAQAALARLMGYGTSYTEDVPSVEVQGKLGGAQTTYICHDCKTQPLRSLEFIQHCSTKQHLNRVRNEPYVSAIVTALQAEAVQQWSHTARR